MELYPKVVLALCADHDRRAFSGPLPLASDKALAPALCSFIAVNGVQIRELLQGNETTRQRRRFRLSKQAWIRRDWWNALRLEELLYL